MRKKIYDDPHPWTGLTLTKLGTALLQQDRFETADSLLQRALQIYRETLRPRHPRVAEGLMTRGRIQAGQGRYAEAVALHQRALSISCEQHSNDHTAIALMRMYLGRALMEQDRYQEAESHLTHSLRVFRREEEEEKVRRLRSDLAGLYTEWGKPKKVARYRPPKQSGNQDPER